MRRQRAFHKSTKTRLWAPSLRRGGEEIVNSLSAHNNTSHCYILVSGKHLICRQEKPDILSLLVSIAVLFLAREPER